MVLTFLPNTGQYHFFTLKALSFFCNALNPLSLRVANKAFYRSEICWEKKWNAIKLETIKAYTD